MDDNDSRRYFLHIYRLFIVGRLFNIGNTFVGSTVGKLKREFMIIKIISAGLLLGLKSKWKVFVEQLET